MFIVRGIWVTTLLFDVPGVGIRVHANDSSTKIHLCQIQLDQFPSKDAPTEIVHGLASPTSKCFIFESVTLIVFNNRCGCHLVSDDTNHDKENSDIKEGLRQTIQE